jgi:hypothetical protein
VNDPRGAAVHGNSSNVPTVLSIGLHPRAVDYSRHPGLDEATLAARITAGDEKLMAAGFDFVSCQLPAEPDDAEVKLRDCVGSGAFEVAMIGAGVRMVPEHSLLFERVVNVLCDLSPGITLCFNTTPEDTADALRRGLQSARAGRPAR